MAGKGESVCANVICEKEGGLRGMEVVFRYAEDNEEKNVLVKCVLCERCRKKLRNAQESKANETEEQIKRHHNLEHEKIRERRRKSRDDDEGPADGRLRKRRDQSRQEFGTRSDKTCTEEDKKSSKALNI